jgi:hypothetical protein
LNNLKKELDNGSLKIRLQLIEPINRSDEFDKVIEMFNWKLSENIELTQAEFNEYVHDETNSSMTAKLANFSYSGKH